MSGSRQNQNPKTLNQGPKPALRKPVFVKIGSLLPGTYGHNIVAKVVRATPVVQNKPGGPTQPRITECLIADQTASILFTARNEQVDLMKPGSTVIIRNARIDMFKGTMRLGVDKWGRIEGTTPAQFVVNEDNNLSLIEYELVNVQE